ncbi:MAG: EscN/YscN/HrcN family type III secretion system ATPase, partial [Gemmatimonadales bacterium]|nr:EscN/YscN/HrcN family type III secretion system ATPase [Gemmatimonadales bacterium]
MNDWQATDIGVAIAQTPRFAVHGRVTRVIGQIVEATSLEVAVGEVCRILVSGDVGVLAQVVGFHDRGIMLMPLGDLDGIHPGDVVVPLGRSLYAEVGEGLIGRVLNGLGRPIDSDRPIGVTRRYPLSA